MNNEVGDIKIIMSSGEYIPTPSWIHTQTEEPNLLDANTWRTTFDKNSIKAILAEHVKMNLTYEEGIKAAKLCFPYLQPFGYIRCSVPDGYCPDPSYQHTLQTQHFNSQSHTADHYKTLHNYHTLTRMFERAGYEVHLLKYFDEDGVLHQNEWTDTEGVTFCPKKNDRSYARGRIVFPSLIVSAVKPRGNKTNINLV
ncbi:SAM-dependent methyltransferase [Priestia koreensis]|uniref:SAM-dependent methyltransferase n=1 Tax=Priestia koreensis TaxID=284581 RepID=UPI003016B881